MTALIRVLLVPLLWIVVSTIVSTIVSTAAPAAVASTSTILVLGDSLSAAYGIEPDQGWVRLLQERLDATVPGYSVVNASVSGETTGGGLARLPRALERHAPGIVIIELGGNDGLRGYPIARIRGNLSRMVQLSIDSGASVLLAGMFIPPNYGQRYMQGFHETFHEVAAEHAVSLVPFLLEGIATDAALMQGDGIHPTADAQPLLLDNLWPILESMLDGELARDDRTDAGSDPSGERQDCGREFGGLDAGSPPAIPAATPSAGLLLTASQRPRP